MSELSPYRVPHDFYPTPPEATRALLSVESFDGTIWEPACGDGAIAKVLIRAGYRVVTTDLIDRGYGDAPVDFLTQTTARARHVVTNPPYGRGLADAFVRHALCLTAQTGGSVAMLLDLSGLAHPLRHHLWVTTKPAAVYVLDHLVCPPAGGPVRFTPNQRYCWVLWRPGHQGRAELAWLTTAPFKDPPTPRRR